MWDSPGPWITLLGIVSTVLGAPLAVAIRAIITGRLVPQAVVTQIAQASEKRLEDKTAESTYLRSANEKLAATVGLQAQQIDDLTEAARTTLHIAESIQSAGDGHG